MKYLTLVPRILFLLVFSSACLAQIPEEKNQFNEIGIPFMWNYHPDEYQGHGQNWGIVQDRDGLIYFANTDGKILQFDGVTWRNISVSNGSIVRSLAIDSAGTIYAGAQNEFGYLSPDSTGTICYISMVSRLDSAYREFGNVWQTHATPDGIYFSTRMYLFRLDLSGQIRIWGAAGAFQSSFYLPGKGLYIHQMETGLMHLINDTLQVIPGGETFKNDRVYVLLPGPDDRLLIGARKMGLFLLDDKKAIPFSPEVSRWLVENQIYHGICLGTGAFVFTTIRGGMIVLDDDGKAKLVINKSKGLPDNNIWYVYEDRESTLWLATNRGLAQVIYPSPFGVFDQRTGLEGNVQDIVRHEGVIFAATGLGLYRKTPPGPLDDTYGFEVLPGLRSQCWSLLSLGDRLLVSCNQGVYQWDQMGFTLVTNKSSWKMIRSTVDTNRIYLGLDDGVASLYRTGRIWHDEGRLPDITIEARTVAEDREGRLWIGSVYDGIYRVQFEGSTNKILKIDRFDTVSGLPSMNYNLVFPDGDDILFGTSNRIYRFNPVDSRFSPINAKSESDLYDSRWASYTVLAVGEYNNIWFNRNERPAQIKQGRLLYRKFLPVPRAPLYTFYPEPDGPVWMGGPAGLLRYDESVAQKIDHNFNTTIRRIAINRDSTIFNGADPERFSVHKISYAQHDLRFEFAATSYINTKQNIYQYFLEGFDQDWSKWTDETRKDYTHIPEGSYTFKVRARNVYQNTSEVVSFSFIVTAPWFRTGLAYFIYLMLFMIISYTSVRVIVNHAQRKAIAERKKVEIIEKAAEEKLRSRVAADFHDELGNRITRISLFGEILMNDLKTKNEQTRNYLTRIIENADNLYNETRDFIWQLDPKKDTLYDLVVRLKNFADELFEGTDIAFKVSGFNRNLGKIRLNMDRRQHILRIFKEALHNALKYAGCQNIRFIIEINNAAKLTLHDDGIGFDTGNHKNHGNGLDNMADRARALNGNLLIESKPGQGTSVQLTIKLPEQAVV